MAVWGAKKAASGEALTLALLLSLLRGPAAPPWDAAPPLARRSTLKNLLLQPRYDALLSELATLAAPTTPYGAPFNPFNPFNPRNNRAGSSVAAYLLTTQLGGGEPPPPPPVPPPSPPPPQQQPPPPEVPPQPLQHHDLSPEDMNLIEVLWKQDVDIGVPPLQALEEPPPPPPSDAAPDKPPPKPFVKQLEDEEEEEEEEGPMVAPLDPWAGLPYTIDLETGEYELCKAEEEALGFDPDVSSVLPAFDSFSLEEALKIAGLDQPKSELEEEVEEASAAAVAADPEEAAAMSQAATHLHNLYAPKPPHYESRMQMVRAGAEHQQRPWSELSHLLAPPGAADEHFLAPPPHQAYHLHDPRSVLLHNASLAPPPPLPDFNASAVFAPPPGNQSFGGRSQLGSAVAASMNVSGAAESMPESAYKLEHEHLYYQWSSLQNASGHGEAATGGGQGQGGEAGFFSSILNDEELQLVDMAMNEGMYTMRLLDNSGGVAPTDADGSSDSAVSSMGSERAWGTEPSTSAAYLDYCGGGGGGGNKYRPYDYSGGGYSAGAVRGPAAGGVGAQKKHHMFAKRYFTEQGKETSLLPPEAAGAAHHVGHNHTYQLPGPPEPAAPHTLAHPQRRAHRDKHKASSISEDEHLSRDEKRARSMDVPITVDDIINLPMDEFNERLSKYDLTEAQLSLIRDIRRRGKNKVAAQNCRKRKLDQILSLADEVKLMRMRKNRLLRDKECMLSQRQSLKDKFSQLYRHVFQALRDADGHAYSPYEFSLQQAADGSVLLVPRADHPKPRPP